MDPSGIKCQWIWHPNWVDWGIDSAGGFVSFRKELLIDEVPETSVLIRVTADTRYRLYLNEKFVSHGPVKGDAQMWFYEELDITPFLRAGINMLQARVLRFYHASSYAPSFVRMPLPGFCLWEVASGCHPSLGLKTDASWETALDTTTRLRIDQEEDHFLHIYEDVVLEECAAEWLPAKVHNLPTSHGLLAPWKLSPRLIPFPQRQPVCASHLHNLDSPVSKDKWEQVILSPGAVESGEGLSLPAGTTHRLHIEVPHHLTAELAFHFRRPQSSGSTLQVTYSECYEDQPDMKPYLRRKGDRRDTSKGLFGPSDMYRFTGSNIPRSLAVLGGDSVLEDEVFAPFHFRTFRFLAIEIQVAKSCDLGFHGLSITETRYPLEVMADFQVGNSESGAAVYHNMWSTSIRTLQNCMHDGYEDCPFYEQLQYAMDARSSALFTYCLGHDDRMARQAIIQLCNTYQPALGLTASRGPAHQLQIIPNFALFWICMVYDHFMHHGDSDFTRPFIPVCEKVLQTFQSHINDRLGLIAVPAPSSGYWDFVDWIPQWKPLGIPKAAERTGYQTYTNMLYAYILRLFGDMLAYFPDHKRAQEYRTKADNMVRALTAYCFDGRFFTDGLASGCIKAEDYSEHTQIWAVLCGAVTGAAAVNLLKDTLLSITEETSSDQGSESPQPPSPPSFARASLAMSFYSLRAASVNDDLYCAVFKTFWEPWKRQLSQNLTTWMEDEVSQRSDCHAWGSTPIYEFMREVCGLKPVLPGWEVLDFKPRVTLLPALDARVPFGGMPWSGLASVAWCQENGGTRVHLSVRITPPTRVVSMVCPDDSVRSLTDGETVDFLL